MPRSVKKGPFIDGHLAAKIQKTITTKSKIPVKTWSRRSTVIPDAIGITFAVHNGRKFVPVFVTENMVGHKFGEFAPTRTFHGHSGDRKAKVKGKKLVDPSPRALGGADPTPPTPSPCAAGRGGGEVGGATLAPFREWGSCALWASPPTPLQLRGERSATSASKRWSEVGAMRRSLAAGRGPTGARAFRDAGEGRGPPSAGPVARVATLAPTLGRGSFRGLAPKKASQSGDRKRRGARGAGPWPRERGVVLGWEHARRLSIPPSAVRRASIAERHPLPEPWVDGRGPIPAPPPARGGPGGPGAVSLAPPFESPRRREPLCREVLYRVLVKTMRGMDGPA